ncbi:CBS domain-containing protein [Microcoleus sp. FACHB-1515]|uniref:CBS domain-containing protein n=1 Tax=Cyanophyceae TaxID=3028117 RepID=UPI001683F17B|nr:CBS domain-containing protein [Microcoleus sp. FACHB-1515]MBD2090879.1 CBS domain-containing protein [Microcoleus sp. FACHB-1515]
MELICCHINADFDTLGAAVGLSRLRPGARIVLTGGCDPIVREFLALHRDEYALIDRRSVNVDEIQSIALVDTQWRDRVGVAAEWLDLPNVKISIYDHHLASAGDIPTACLHQEPVGAITTFIAEQLQAAEIALTVSEATVMALGIHADTGSLTFDQTTVRDAAALTWLMAQGASISAIAQYAQPGLSPQLQEVLACAIEQLQTETQFGLSLASVLLHLPTLPIGLSSVTERLMRLTEADVLLFAAASDRTEAECRMTIVGRARADVNLAALLKPFGGGGHAKAASASLRTEDPEAVMAQLRQDLRDRLPHPLTAREIMSSPVRTIRPDTTIAEAQRILLRYGHAGLSVVDASDRLVGVISRRDLDIALHHGFSHAPVKGYMSTNLKTIAPDSTLPEIEALMVTYDIGRLPVLDQDQLVGIVTRTDVLRQLHQGRTIDRPTARLVVPPPAAIAQLLKRLSPELQAVLKMAANQAEQRGWQLYLVGGAVRDLLLSDPASGALQLVDIDLVVDGFHRSADAAAGVELARALQQTFPDTRLQVHGKFQTAALLWPHRSADSQKNLALDIATARTEFYPYPAANPEVEASSIRQDLYRRDFTINALAIRLTAPRTSELLDFFGGLLDLQAKRIRVLHSNSFIEDPTRIYRAVRFATRLHFTIDPQTEGYIRHAIASGVFDRIQAEMEKTPALQTRLRRELKYLLEAAYWQPALSLLSDLGGLRCLHPDLEMTPELHLQLRRADRWLKRFDRAQSLEHWLVLLEVLLAQLSPPDRPPVAKNLQLPAETIDRLTQLDAIEARLQAELPAGYRPSQIVQQLQALSIATLVLVAVRSSRSIRRAIWQYLTVWSTIKPPLDGNDLRKLGYRPGQQFKFMLSELQAATLDGEVSDRASAEAFLAERFPL